MSAAAQLIDQRLRDARELVRRYGDSHAPQA
jgi:hypothetical protein